MIFVNRSTELAQLEDWWTRGQGLGLVWGRRRVGKTSLLEEFARGKRAIFHTFDGRPTQDELVGLSGAAAGVLDSATERDLRSRPFATWDDLIDELTRATGDGPLLLVLDEFPEALRVMPSLPNLLRGAERRIRASALRILICGSATRTMAAIQQDREPLYGRFDLQLLVHPFGPTESALMLRDLAPTDRALVWGILGGVPLYLSWWDQSRSVRDNLVRLACTPGQGLLGESELVLRGELLADLERRVLLAVAAGRTRWSEIRDAVEANPTRSLENLVDLRIVERLVPVTEEGQDVRKVRYRVSDNFLAFALGPLAAFRTEINRGLGDSIVGPLMDSLDDHMGGRWEAALRQHLVQLANTGALGPDVVAIGPFWMTRPPAKDADPAEMDAVVLAGRRRAPVAVGEAKWARTVDGDAIRSILERKATSLPGSPTNLTYIVAAREEVRNAGGVLALTAANIFP